jgi:hypothetical protein
VFFIEEIMLDIGSKDSVRFTRKLERKDIRRKPWRKWEQKQSTRF